MRLKLFVKWSLQKVQKNTVKLSEVAVDHNQSTISFGGGDSALVRSNNSKKKKTNKKVQRDDEEEKVTTQTSVNLYDNGDSNDDGAPFNHPPVNSSAPLVDDHPVDYDDDDDLLVGAEDIVAEPGSADASITPDNNGGTKQRRATRILSDAVVSLYLQDVRRLVMKDRKQYCRPGYVQHIIHPHQQRLIYTEMVAGRWIPTR